MGLSPPVTTEAEWENLTREIDLITQDRSILPEMWLSATEGDKNLMLAGLDHWPNTELVKNETRKLKATETIWRDFYTGHQLGNWTKPYRSSSQADTVLGEYDNCIQVKTDRHWDESWEEWQCHSYQHSCPCSYPAQPLLRLRGLCSPLICSVFTPKQLPGNPGNMILLGQLTTRIEYKSSQWVSMMLDWFGPVDAL